MGVIGTVVRRTRRPVSPDRFLGIYLDDHLAAATGGVALARRARDAQEGRDPDLHRFLVTLTGEIEEDRRVIVDATRRLGTGRDPLKIVAGAVGERLGRLKANGRLVQRSPLSDLVELEGLSIAVRGKRLGWLTLGDVDHEALRGIDFAALARRAEDQADRIEARRRPLAERVLTG